MAPKKGKKRSVKTKAKKKAAKTRLAAAKPFDDPFITIFPDGTYDPPSGVKITPGGVVKFKISGNPNGNTCYIPFGQISFGDEAQPGVAAVGTIKVGSGN